MAPALKAKRLKKTGKRSLTAVANEKPKWEKPRKSISAQSGVAKIKNVNKRSFDPIKANRGVVLLQSIPHGFYEDEMRKYFGQFGLVTRVRLARCQRTGRSKGFAYIEFKVPEVAEIAAETMNNYIMFKHKLKAAYIPPEKQTYNFFRKDVTFTTDANGETTFSSAKMERIQKAVDNTNRILTDEEHAKRMKRDEKLLKKQQKKLGVDLSNILASGNSSSSDAAQTTEVKPKESKKKAAAATAAKNGAEKKPATKRDDNKIATKKDKKKAANKVSSTGDEPLWHKLLDKTLDTDTSDDDFKIDHTFESVDDSDGLVGLLSKKLSQSADDEESDSEIDTDDDVDTDDEDGFEINDESEEDGKSEDVAESDDEGDSEDDEDSEDDGESDDVEGWEDDADSDNDMAFEESELDDDESEDSEPEIVRQTSKDKKKLVKGATSSGAVDVKAKPNLKRKHKEDSSSLFSEPTTPSSQSELDTGAKKQKQNPNKKKNGPSIVKASIPVPEPKKVVVTDKKKQKPNRLEKLTSTSSSEPESTPPTQAKHKKAKLAAQMPSKLPSESNAGKQKMNKKKAKSSSGESTLSSSVTDTTSSEPEVPKQKLNKKKSKQNASGVSKPANVSVPVKAEKSQGLNLTKKKNQPGQANFNQKTAPSTSTEPELQKSKKKNQPAKDEQTKFKPKTAVPQPAEPAVQQKSKKKNQSAKDEPTIVSPKTVASTSAKPEAQKPKDKQKIVANGESIASKPGAIDKKKKKAKPVTSSLISENGLAKKSTKAKADAKTAPEKSKKSSAWLTVSETDGDEPEKPRGKDAKANLKSIVHKNNSKKKNDKSLDAKKVKQTPDELLQFIASKDLKQKLKKKSK